MDPRPTPDLVRSALTELDTALEERGDAVTEHLARALRAVVVLRDRLISERAEMPDLERVNAVLSLMWSASYPIVGVRWQRIEKARDAVRELLGPA